MTWSGGRPRVVAHGLHVSEVEELLELYGRSMSSEPADDLAVRVMDALAQAVPGVVHRQASGSRDPRTPFAMARLLAGPRRFTIRIALVAMVTAALAAVAVASDSHRDVASTPHAPAETPSLAPSSSPSETAGPRVLDGPAEPAAEEPRERDEFVVPDPDDDAEVEDEDAEDDREETGDLDTEDDRDQPGDADVDIEEEADSTAAEPEEEERPGAPAEEQGSADPAETEPDAIDAPDPETGRAD